MGMVLKKIKKYSGILSIFYFLHYGLVSYLAKRAVSHTNGYYEDSPSFELVMVVL